MPDDEWNKLNLSHFPLPLSIEYINSKYDSFLKEKLKDSAITPTDSVYLTHIYFRQTMSQCDIAKLFYVSQANVAKIVKKLEKNGYIERTKDERNKSRNLISLTEKGLSTTETLIEFSKEWEKEILANLAYEELDFIKSVLFKMAWNSTKF